MTQRYDTYKESGVQWLGEIPEHWGMRKMKYIFDERSEKNHPNEPMLSATQSEGVILQSKYQGRVVVVNTGFDGLKLVKVGDFVIHLRSFQGGIEYAYDQGIISSAYTILNPKYPEFSAYYKRLLKSSAFIDLLKICVTGIREGQNINYSKLKQFFMPLPPLSEQHAIVTYLDDKCGKIDKVVEGKQKQIELLAEMKQRIIADAVTRGLNPNVTMKATNIPWLKEIPEHWEKTKVSRIFKQIGSGTTPSSGDASLYAEEGTPWLQSGDFNNNEINSTSKFLTDKALENYCLKLYKPVGVVIAMYGASIGKVGLLNIETTVNQACCVLSDSVNLLQKFAFYVFINEKENLVKKSKGGTQPNISQEIIKSHYIPLPPLPEQRAIVTYLDDKCGKIDLLVEKLKAEIDAIKEYKQRLISDVVTGQIKVC